MSRKMASILAMGAMMASLSDVSMARDFSERPRRVLSPKQNKARMRSKAVRKQRRKNRKH